MSGIRLLLIGLLASAVLVLVACGGDDDTTASDTTTTTTTGATGVAGGGDCDPIEEVDVELGGTHFDRDFTADDYETNPPTGGDHNPTPLQPGAYPSPPRLGEAVHLLEHGAVIVWTKDPSDADWRAAQQELKTAYNDGYYQIALIENDELDVPFALSAWGAMQKCSAVDTSAIRPFIEEWYASPKTAEGGLACQGDARTLPNC